MAAYRALTARDAKNATAWAGLAKALEKKGDAEGAIAAWKKVAAIEPSDTAAPLQEEPGERVPPEQAPAGASTETALLEQVLDRENLLRALKRVKAMRRHPWGDFAKTKQTLPRVNARR